MEKEKWVIEEQCFVAIF